MYMYIKMYAGCGKVVEGMSHNLAVIGMMDELVDESNEKLHDS